MKNAAHQIPASHPSVNLTGKQISSFWDKIEISTPDSCWLWYKCVDEKGYGILHICNKTKRAHRTAFEIVNGPIPAGLCVCHRCDVRNCCNPAHLWIGTDADNSADKLAKGRQVVMIGEKHGMAVISDQIVRQIRSEYKRGIVTGKMLAHKYSIANSTIMGIIYGQSWKHVK